MTNFKFASWNIGSTLSNFGDNFSYIKKILSLKTPDIICFQEFPSSIEIINELCTSCSFIDYIFLETSPTHVTSNWNMGLCILSKYKLKEPIILELPKPETKIYYAGIEEEWHSKYFLMTSCVLESHSLNIINGHGFPFYRYDLDEKQYIGIYKMIDDWIKKNYLSGTYLIGADFNVKDALQFMPFINSTHFDVFFGVPTRPSGRKTDVIAIPNNMSIISTTNLLGPLDHNYLEIKGNIKDYLYSLRL